MAICSPRWKSAFVVIVWWISVSKTVMKQDLQSFEWSFGRSIRARFVLHSAQGVGGILRGGVVFGLCIAGGYFLSMGTTESVWRCMRVILWRI